MKLLTNLDMGQNKIIGLVLEPRNEAPDNAVAGQVYFNSQDDRVYVYTGDTWVAMDAKDANPTSAKIVNAINSGENLINIDKIKDLAGKLSSENIVDTINSGDESIQLEKISEYMDLVKSADLRDYVQKHELLNFVEKNDVSEAINNLNKDGKNELTLLIDTLFNAKYRTEEEKYYASEVLTRTAQVFIDFAKKLAEKGEEAPHPGAVQFEFQEALENFAKSKYWL